MAGKVNWYKTLVWGIFLGRLTTLSGPRYSQGNMECVFKCSAVLKKAL